MLAAKELVESAVARRSVPLLAIDERGFLHLMRGRPRVASFARSLAMRVHAELEGRAITDGAP
jgi:hypothetical protein